jgi:hypothetical protein
MDRIEPLTILHSESSITCGSKNCKSFEGSGKVPDILVRIRDSYFSRRHGASRISEV